MLVVLCSSDVKAQNPVLVFEQPINSTQGGGIADLMSGDWFGYDMAPIGDLNGDGIPDIAVGAIYDEDGGLNHGAVYILFMNANGTVGTYQKISDTQGGFQGTLVDESFFGSSIANLGDMNGDGVQDLAVGASGDDDGGNWSGAVWILFMNTDGTVNGHQKISATQGGFSAGLTTMDRFGIGLDSIGDLDGNGIGDLVVGAYWDDDGGPDEGAVYIIYLNPDGTVLNFTKVTSATVGFNGDLSDGASFGWAVSYMGDVNGDGNIEILVGAQRDNVLGFEEGSVWVISINNAGALTGCVEVSVGTSTVLQSVVTGGDRFGSSVTLVHDLWCDDSPDIAVGLQAYGPNDEGAVFLIDLAADFSVLGVFVIAEGLGGLQENLDPLDRFGWGLDVMYDYNGDGFAELMVGAVNFDGGGNNIGGTWLLSMEPSSSESVLPDSVEMCEGAQVQITPSSPVQDILWSTSETSNSIAVSTEGLVWFSGTIDGCNISDTVNVIVHEVPEVDLGSDTSSCDGLELNVSVDGANAQWSTGAIGEQISVSESGIYWVEVSSACGVFYDSINVTVIDGIIASLGSDTTICGDIQYTLNPSISSGLADSYLWNNGLTTPSIVVTEPGLYWVEMENTCGVTTDSILILGGTFPEYYLPSDTSACGSLLLDLSTSGYSVFWSTGSTSSSVEITESGSYSASLSGVCGTISIGFDVTIYSEPSADFLTRSKPVEFIDPNVQFVNESVGATSYEWHLGDGTVSYEENPAHQYDTSGIYLVMLIADAGNGCLDTTYNYVEVDPYVTLYIPNAFTPDADGLNDTFGALGLNFEHESFEFEIFDRWGGLMWQTDNPFHWWDGTHMNSGERVKQGMYVWRISVRHFNTFEPKILVGTVTLYRHN